MRILLRTVVGCSLLGPICASTQAFEGRAVSADGGVVVSYQVEDGYKVTVTIDTRKKKSAYRYSVRSDVTRIAVEFVDVNGDSFQDVIVKHVDEGGYSPRVLINHEDLSFSNALDIGKLVYVRTEPEVTGIHKGGLRVKQLKGQRFRELVLSDVVIGDERYRDATFRYEERTGRYALYRKGASLGKLGQP